MKFLQAACALGALAVSTVSALPKVTRQGKYLYQEDGTRFYVKGISYQEAGNFTTTDPSGFPEPTDYIDPLAIPAACKRDIPFLQQLGVNAIRVYSVNSALNHDECMAALSAAGIYTILDVALPVNGSIDRASPAWTTNLLGLYLGTIDKFLKYDNILAFNIGNEVATGVPDTVSAPFVKAAARDVKAYLKSKGSSALVGYASTDGSAWRNEFAKYLACDTEETSIDLYGLNVYRWCGAGSISSYSSLISDFANYPIPAYFSEFGCITSPPRLWTEVEAIYGQEMSASWSGGLAFSYFPTNDGYGMVTLSADGNTVTTSDDFTRLAAQFTKVQFINSPTKAAAGQNTQVACPPKGPEFLAGTVLPKTPTRGVCDCVNTNAFSCAFTSQSPNTAPIIGELLNYACSQIGTLGGTCAPIGSDGANGTYGVLSSCDPATKLSFALTTFYELSNRAAGSCSFSGNATVVASAPSTASGVTAAIESCEVAAPTGTSVPEPPPTTSGNTQVGVPTGATTGGSTGPGGTKPSSAVQIADVKGLASLAVMVVAAVVGGTALLF